MAAGNKYKRGFEILIGAIQMKYKLNDLNDYLFETMDRLTNDDLTDEELKREISRAEAVKDVASTIIDNGNLALKIKMHLDNYGEGDNIVLPLLETSDE